MTAPVAGVGVLLAGGRSERMGGGDKTLKVLGGRPMLDRVIARARAQVGELFINANGDPSRFAAYGLPVIADVIEGFAGPLAGILTALDWTAVNRPGVAWVASFATDAPFFPVDLVARMTVAVADDKADLACARSGGQTHPVFGLWKVALRDDLRRAMTQEDMRKIDRWTARHRPAHVDFDVQPFDPFFNVNRPENLAEAEAILARAGAAA